MSNGPTIILPNGDKGGSGKSTLTTILGSDLYRFDYRLMILETDVGDAGAIPDVEPRFLQTPGVDVTRMQLEKPNRHTSDTLADMFDLIESSRADFVVMNLPAGASKVLEDVGPLFAAAAAETEVDIRIAYILDRTESAIASADALVEGPVFGAASHTAWVRNGMIASDAEYDRRIDRQGAASRLPRATIGELSADVADQLSEHPSLNLVDLVSRETSPLRTVQRLQLQAWFDKAAASLRNALLPEVPVETKEANT